MGKLFVLVFTICCSVSLITAQDYGEENSVGNSRYACGRPVWRSGVQTIPNNSFAEPGQWPWHVALLYGKDYKCGGTLIDQRLVVTAAHCVINVKQMLHLITVHFGKIYLDQGSNHVQIRNVSEIYIHEEYSLGVNDIALLVLSNNVRYSDYVIPICIDSIQKAKVDDLVGKKGWIVGWGETMSEWMLNRLKTTEVKIVNNTECIQIDDPVASVFITDKVFCAGKLITCSSYSGGGMYILDGDQRKLQGIPSFFVPDNETNSCDFRRFLIFTKVVSYYLWINEKIRRVVYDKAISPKGISQRKCQQYHMLAKKNKKGECENLRSPQTVAIIDRNQRFISSGVIISERFILTKAPTLPDWMGVDWDELRVRTKNEKDIEVIRQIFHPTFNPETNQNDVMILELKTPLVFTESLLPSCLANEATENLFDILLLTGYVGLNKTENVVYENNVNEIITNEQCNQNVQSEQKNKHWIFKEELCATLDSNETFTWQSIIGGPLQTLNTRSCMYTLVGITKFLIPLNEAQYTNVFLRVAAYLAYHLGIGPINKFWDTNKTTG